MNILVVSQLFHPEVAAAPIRLKNMVESLQSRGYKVDVLTAMPNYPTGKVFEPYQGHLKMQEVFGNGTIYRYWIYANNSFNKYKRMFGMISFAVTLRMFGFKRSLIKDYDIIIVQTPPLIVAWSAIKMFRHITKAKIILNVSDIHPLALVHEGHIREGSLYHKILRRMECYIYNASDALMGQSQEIINYITADHQKSAFLYRTLQKTPENTDKMDPRDKQAHNKLVYAGLLSKTQGMLSIIKEIDFKSKGLEFHIYGDGNEREEIQKKCDGVSVFYHGIIPNELMNEELKKYDASIISLSFDSTGAVPSKIYNVVYAGLPVIYMGMKKGEAAQLIERYKVGYIADTNDFEQLNNNLDLFKELPESDYEKLVHNCIHLSMNDFNYNKQMERLVLFLKDQLK